LAVTRTSKSHAVLYMHAYQPLLTWVMAKSVVTSVTTLTSF